MKKYLLLTIIISFLTTNIFSQDFSGIKICINPGHGGFDSDDRFIPETGFWESVGNLDKGLALRDILVGLNANIVMTRTTNTTADDLPLSQIVAIANSNNVDYFHAIHSNAFNGQSNYTLLLFQGFDNNPTYDSAKVMGSLMSDEIFKAHRTTAKYNRGDFDFYGTGQAYLGVFKGLQMPGTLSEGSFHDYIPESWRLRNKAYTKHEAWAIEKAFVNYFHLNENPNGEIAGVVRDANKSVPYYAISSTDDIKLPLNKIRVTLLQNNIIYNGDEFNNGFFLFDSLAPGQYKLIYDVEGYFKDSSMVNVLSNSTTFADKFLQFDTTIAPIVLSSFPLDDPDSVKVTTQIEINFSRPMDTTSTKNAFSITPTAMGNFIWENNNQKLTFIPDSLEIATRYIVSLSTEAKSIWNVPFDSVFSFSFTTKNRDRLTLLSSYPIENQNDISTTLQIQLVFDAAIFPGSLTGKINLYNSSNDRINIKNVKIFSKNGKGLIYFEPRDPLENNSFYKLVLSQGISDTASYSLQNNVEINFLTEDQFNFSSLIINDFESLDNWMFAQAGTDTLFTNFNLSTVQKITGSKSGKINYKFVSDAGNIALSNSYSVNSDITDSTEFGVWIFGDNSKNLLKFVLTNASLSPDTLFMDSLNWTGWKFKHFLIAQLLSVDKNLNYSFEVQKDSNGINSGTLYFDDALLTSLLTDVNELDNEIPGKFSLSQNYPNPFNPTTRI
ncbi:MAG: Ig-like domain-containing protein, partial [Ignavibacteriaceae bacterium]